MPAVALVDLDGTLADYDGAMLRDMSALAGPNEEDYLPYTRSSKPYIISRENLIKRIPGWWSSLHPIEENMALVHAMKDIGFCIHILTKGPSSKSQAWAEKVEWTRKWLPFASITVTEDKQLVYGKILFDDFPEYQERWLKFRPRGLGIVPLKESNKHFKHPNVVFYDGKNLREIKEMLQEVYRKSLEKDNTNNEPKI